MHYQMGGIKTDVDGCTSMRGLYAAGETACVSVHGGNRLGANSLLDTLVFGRRSGEHAANFARGVVERALNDGLIDRENRGIQAMMDRAGEGELFGSIRLDMGRTMNERLAVFRDDEGMRDAVSKLTELRNRFDSVAVTDKGKTFNTNLLFTLELGFMLDCAEAIALSGLERKESRGAHFRTDMPERDDKNWLKHILVSRGADGPIIENTPVIITQWEPQERKY